MASEAIRATFTWTFSLAFSLAAFGALSFKALRIGRSNERLKARFWSFSFVAASIAVASAAGFFIAVPRLIWADLNVLSFFLAVFFASLSAFSFPRYVGIPLVLLSALYFTLTAIIAASYIPISKPVPIARLLPYVQADKGVRGDFEALNRDSKWDTVTVSLTCDNATLKAEVVQFLGIFATLFGSMRYRLLGLECPDGSRYGNFNKKNAFIDVFRSGQGILSLPGIRSNLATSPIVRFVPLSAVVYRIDEEGIIRLDSDR